MMDNFAADLLFLCDGDINAVKKMRESGIMSDYIALISYKHKMSKK